MSHESKKSHPCASGERRTDAGETPTVKAHASSTSAEIGFLPRKRVTNNPLPLEVQFLEAELAFLKPRHREECGRSRGGAFRGTRIERLAIRVEPYTRPEESVQGRSPSQLDVFLVGNAPVSAEPGSIVRSNSSLTLASDDRICIRAQNATIVGDCPVRLVLEHETVRLESQPLSGVSPGTYLALLRLPARLASDLRSPPTICVPLHFVPNIACDEGDAVTGPVLYEAADQDLPGYGLHPMHGVYYLPMPQGNLLNPVLTKAPLALILHGNDEFCLPEGQVYKSAFGSLLRCLAGHGFVAASVMFKHGLYAAQRALLAQKHLDLVADLVAKKFLDIRSQKIILIGHSRGAEAAPFLANLLAQGDPTWSDVRGVVAMAPTEPQLSKYLEVTSHVLHIYGDADGDTGEQTLNEYKESLATTYKGVMLLPGTTHWGLTDLGADAMTLACEPSAPKGQTEALLPYEEQREIARNAAVAFALWRAGDVSPLAQHGLSELFHPYDGLVRVTSRPVPLAWAHKGSQSTHCTSELCVDVDGFQNLLQPFQAVDPEVIVESDVGGGEVLRWPNGGPGVLLRPTKAKSTISQYLGKIKSDVTAVEVDIAIVPQKSLTLYEPRSALVRAGIVAEGQPTVWYTPGELAPPHVYSEYPKRTYGFAVTWAIPMSWFAKYSDRCTLVLEFDFFEGPVDVAVGVPRIH